MKRNNGLGNLPPDDLSPSVGDVFTIRSPTRLAIACFVAPSESDDYVAVRQGEHLVYLGDYQNDSILLVPYSLFLLPSGLVGAMLYAFNPRDQALESIE